MFDSIWCEISSFQQFASHFFCIFQETMDSPTSPTSILSMTDSSCSTTDFDDVTRVLFSESPNKADVVVENKSTLEVVSPDSTKSTASLYGSELLSNESDELCSPTNFQQQKPYRTNDSIDFDQVSPVFESEGNGQNKYSNKTTKLKEDIIFIHTDNVDDGPFLPSLCSGSFNTPDGVMNMFDISPKAWSGWSLKSPPETPLQSVLQDQLHQPLEETQVSVETEYTSTPLSRYQINGHKLNLDDDIDPVIEADSGTDEATTRISNITSPMSKSWDRRVNNLEQSYATLKDVVRANSKMMIQLKSDFKFFRKNDVKYFSKFDNQNLSMITTERDALSFRESQYIDTIQILKNELKRLSSKSIIVGELKSVQLHNKILANQIIEKDMELEGLQETLTLAEAENVALREELKSYENRTEDRKEKYTQESSEMIVTLGLLQQQLKDLTERITVFENSNLWITYIQKNQATIPKHHEITKCIDQNFEENESICISFYPESEECSTRQDEQHFEHNRTEEITVKMKNERKNTIDDDQVEVTLAGMIITASNRECINNVSVRTEQRFIERPEQYQPTEIQKKRWSLFCDCFPFLREQSK